MPTKRLRVFAGPNGSGKTTILERIPKELNLGYIVNADDIEKTLSQDDFYTLNGQNLNTNTDLLQNYLRNEGFSIHKIKDPGFIDHIIVTDNNIHIPKQFVNSVTDTQNH